MDSGYDSALRIVGKRHDLIGLVLKDPHEIDLPDVGLITFKDAETDSQRWIDTHDRKIRDGFRMYLDTIQKSRRSLFLKSKLDGVEIPLDKSYMKPLVEFFRLRERRW
jgi:hypothetical protein